MSLREVRQSLAAGCDPPVACSAAGTSCPGSSGATSTDHSTMRRPMSWTVSPAQARTSATEPCAGNSRGTPMFRTGVGTPRVGEQLRQPGAETAVDAAVLDADDQARAAARGRPARDRAGAPSAGRRPGRCTRPTAPTRRPRARRPRSRPRRPRGRRCARRRPARRARPTLPSRRTVGTAGPIGVFGNRTTLGPSEMPTASCSCSRSAASSRGAATRMPGTTPRMARSQTPLWLGPSSPVMPARSRTNVTGNRCSATSSSTWSKARLRNVA